ncbi:MAG: RHS repeat-associated core domain-containing protein [Spirochaetales bacterium]|nr:RHS repeat-associated core domain-containing protein [Spirochaetales bacterium]
MDEAVHKYTDQEKDDTGLYYYGARYYDPEIGRFISPDSVLAGLNRYAYCFNNPIKYVDPSGHVPYTPDEVIAIQNLVNDSMTLNKCIVIAAPLNPVTGVSIIVTIAKDVAVSVGARALDDYLTQAKWNDESRGPNYRPPANRKPPGKSSGGPEQIPDPSDPGNLDPGADTVAKIVISSALIAQCQDEYKSQNISNPYASNEKLSKATDKTQSQLSNNSRNNEQKESHESYKVKIVNEYAGRNGMPSSVVDAILNS